MALRGKENALCKKLIFVRCSIKWGEQELVNFDMVQYVNSSDTETDRQTINLMGIFNFDRYSYTLS